MPISWSEVSTDTRNRLLNVYTKEPPAALDEAAQTLGMHPETLRRRLREYRQQQILIQRIRNGDSLFPLSPSRTYTDYTTIQTDNAIIISDVEIPDHNALYLLLALLVAIVNNIRILIIAGDFIASDQDGLNHWISTWRATGEVNYEGSIGLMLWILRVYEIWFTDGIYMIEGNHDDRVSRVTGGEVHLGMLIHGNRVKYSRYSFMWVQTSRGPVKVVHPQNFSGDPVVLGQQLYNVEPIKAHYVIGHCHREQYGMSPDGMFEIYCLGTGRDPLRTKYKATKVNKHKQWDTSFLMIRDGYLEPLSLKRTNWKRALGGLYRHVQSYFESPMSQQSA